MHISKKSSNFAAGKKFNSHIYMKKLIVLVFICVTCALASYAGDSIPAVPQPCSVMLARAGDHYYLGNERMDMKQTLQWLKEQDCRVAYDLFNSGMKIAKAGWYLFGTGILLNCAGWGLTLAAIDHGSLKGGLIAWKLIGGLGSSVEMAAIATIATGYYKMHHTVDVYNTHCYKRPEPRPYWALQASENGIGLAYKF